MHTDAAKLLELLGTPLDTHARVDQLGMAQQQVVEIAKALSPERPHPGDDEPTAALSEPEIAMLFDRIRKLKQDGIAIIYISHRLREVFEIGDRITVLRDGRVAASLIPSQTSAGELVRLMIGRESTTVMAGVFARGPESPFLKPAIFPQRTASMTPASHPCRRNCWPCRPGRFRSHRIGARDFWSRPCVSRRSAAEWQTVERSPRRFRASGSGPGSGKTEKPKDWL